MASVIDILINALWRGGSATNRAEQDLKDVGTAVDRGRDNFAEYAKAAGVATAALGAAAIAGREAVQTLEEGAGLILARQRFDRLAESVGTTGDALRNDLRQATSGMLSDMQAMSLATDLLALDLATTSDQAVRMARVVTELNQDVGELQQALSNQTTRRFDQLNVSVAGFDERLQELQKTMSDEEAFTMAFLEQAEAQIERVGGAADSTRGDLMRLEATMADVNDAFKIGFAEGAADSLDDMSDSAVTAEDKLAALSHTIGLNVVPTIESFLKTFILTGPPLFLVNKLLELLAKAQGEVAESTERAAQEAEGADQVLRNYRDSAEEAANAVDKLNEATVNLGTSLRTLRNLEDVAERIANAKPGPGRFSLDDLAGSPQAQAQSGRADFINEMETGRADLFEDFIQDQAAIAERYEARRTEIVEQYGARRVEAEEDLQRSIARVQSDAAERAADLREDANNRLEELEEDHLTRMRRIIEDADINLRDAASRLDASAVARIERQREIALAREQENYEDQRESIEETLERQLEAIEKNSRQRIKELEEFHRIRQQREEQAYRQRLQQLDRQERQEQQLRQQQYVTEYRELTNWWDSREGLQRLRMGEILDAERRWWQSRRNLVPDSSTGGAVPSYQTGTPYVPQDGLAFLHKGEAVLPPAAAAAMRAGRMGSSITIQSGAISMPIYAQPGQSAEDIGHVVEKRLERILRGLAGS